MPGNDRHRLSGNRTLRYVGVGVLTVAAVAAAGYALTRNTDPNGAAIAASYTPPALEYSGAPAPSASATPSVEASVTPTPTATAAATPPRVVFLGDGYTASVDATDSAHGFPALVGHAENWNVSVVSCSGAGYVANGTCGTDYAGLIPKVVADKPSIVVVTGGRNDTPDYQQSASAADSFYSQLTAALPSATVYAISPVWDSTQGQAPLGTVQASVKAAASAHGATYVDIGEPLKGHPEMISSGVMPNDAGYAAIASAIEGALPKQ